MCHNDGICVPRSNFLMNCLSPPRTVLLWPGSRLRSSSSKQFNKSSHQRRKRSVVRLRQSEAQTPPALESSRPSRLMKRCLVDVNVLLALLVIQHEHHELARKWFDSLAADEAGLCRIVQLALVRLLANRSIIGMHAVSASVAWNLIERLLEDERIDFIPE